MIHNEERNFPRKAGIFDILRAPDPFALKLQVNRKSMIDSHQL